MAGSLLTVLAAAAWVLSLLASSRTQAPAATTQARAPHAAADTLFESSDRCFACHNNVFTPKGEDVSIAPDWRATMMANSSRDPYWQASVRRETLDHPEAAAEIEDECSICHMPMTTFAARAAGGKGRVFENLPIGQSEADNADLAADGVSCTVCHQLSSTRLGDPSTFTGGYIIDTTKAGADTRQIFGPFAIDPGRARIMQSSSGFTPTSGTHVQQPELCASCHTLFTKALAPGAAGMRLPEQMPFLEWQQSSFRATSSCQTCHMPVVEVDAPLTSVLGQARPGVSRHVFRGGNFFMLRMLNRYRDELGVRAPSKDLEAGVRRTIDHLEQDTARIAIDGLTRAGSRIELDTRIENLTGHKFPTAYPSRRAWVQVTATDASGRVLFDSGAFQPSGRITGNDNDDDAAKFEPHYSTISRADQVQIYESIMAGPAGAPTTGLLTGVRYVKDNRLLPKGFNKAGAPPDTAVHGDARTDADFEAGQDRVHYSIDTSGATGAVTIMAKLWFQPIGFRWAETLKGYKSFETERFVRYYQALSSESAVVVAQARADVK